MILENICPAPSQDDGSFEVLFDLTKFGGKDNRRAYSWNGTDDIYFCKTNKKFALCARQVSIFADDVFLNRIININLDYTRTVQN